MSIVTIQEVVTEFVKKPKGGYSVATVTYTDNGKNFTKKIMSFANPAVYDAIKDAKQGETYDVTAVKDGEYWNWSKVVKVDKDVAANSAPNPPGTGRVLGSNYETADERKLKQLYIIKQSSIANAIEFAKMRTPGEEPYTPGDILDLAQQFVDYVYSVEDTLANKSDVISQ